MPSGILSGNWLEICPTKTNSGIIFLKIRLYRTNYPLLLLETRPYKEHHTKTILKHYHPCVFCDNELIWCHLVAPPATLVFNIPVLSLRFTPDWWSYPFIFPSFINSETVMIPPGTLITIGSHRDELSSYAKTTAAEFGLCCKHNENKQRLLSSEVFKEFFSRNRTYFE